MTDTVDPDVALLRQLKEQAGGTPAPAAAQPGMDPDVAQLRALRAQVSDQPKSASAPAKVFQEAQSAPGFWNTLSNGVTKGAAGFADMLPNAAVNVANLGIAGYGMGKHLLTGSNDLPDTIAPDALSGWSKIGNATGLIRDSAEPTTAPGRVLDMVGQTLGGGGINPSAMARSLTRGQWAPLVRDLVAPVVSGVGAGVGSEYARGVDTGSTALDNAIKIAATLGGGAIPGMAVAARGTAGDRAAAATKGLTDAQITAARLRARTAADQGSPITGYEAIQAETGLNPKMQTQQRVAEQSDSAARNLTPMMQARPGNNANLFAAVTDGISPHEALPDTLAGQMQTAAQRAIDQTRSEGNARATPFYAATSNDPSVRIPSSDWNSALSNPGIVAALRAVKSDPFSGLQNAVEGSAQWLDAAKKWLDSQSQSKAQSGDRFAAGNRSGAASTITDAMDPTLPDYARARAIIADNMRNNVEPMEQGQVGKLSRSDDFKQQSSTLLPDAPADVTPQVVERTANTIGAQNPDILSQFLAQDLRRKYAEATQQNMGGENAMGGAKFAANVAGNPIQNDNLIQALRSSGVNPQPFNDAIGTFRAQGYKPPANSATSANLAESASLKNLVASGLGAIPRLNEWWTNGLASRNLANALSSGPHTVDDIMALARTNGTYSPLKQQMLVNLLNSGNSVQPYRTVNGIPFYDETNGGN